MLSAALDPELSFAPALSCALQLASPPHLCQGARGDLIWKPPSPPARGEMASYGNIPTAHQATRPLDGVSELPPPAPISPPPTPRYERNRKQNSHTHTLPALFLSLNTIRSTLPLPGQSEESGALNSACGGVGGGALGSPLSLQHSLPLIWAPCPPACPAPRLRAALLSPIVVRLRQRLPYTFSLDPRCLSSNLRHKPHLPMPEPILSVLLPTPHLPGVSAATFLSQWRSGEVIDSGCHGWACPQGREWHRQTHSCPCHPGTCTRANLVWK